MTEAEVALATDVFGDGLDTAPVRIGKDIGLAPPPRRAEVSVEVRRPAEDPCVRVPPPPRNAAPPAFAVGNSIYFSGQFYSVDGGFLWPDAVRLPHTLILVHELVHVWQWQNRDLTNYTPFKALSEGFSGDAYFYGADDAPDLFRFGYEQQASIVEDYLCYLILDPSDPVLGDLRTLVEPMIDVERLEASIDAARRQ